MSDITIFFFNLLVLSVTHRVPYIDMEAIADLLGDLDYDYDYDEDDEEEGVEDAVDVEADRGITHVTSFQFLFTALIRQFLPTQGDKATPLISPLACSLLFSPRIGE